MGVTNYHVAVIMCVYWLGVGAGGSLDAPRALSSPYLTRTPRADKPFAPTPTGVRGISPARHDHR